MSRFKGLLTWQKSDGTTEDVTWSSSYEIEHQIILIASIAYFKQLEFFYNQLHVAQNEGPRDG